MSHHLISLMILLPLLGAVMQFALPGRAGSGEAVTSSTRFAALGTSLLSSICGVVVVLSMSPQPELQATETIPWIGSYAIFYDMGVDGLNALLVLLGSILFPVLIATEWNQKSGVRGLHGLFLVLQTAFFGAVCAQNLFLQFFFWAFGALPFYFLIGIWGGSHRESAASRSIVASAIGNAFLFAALLLIYYSVDPHTFSLHELSGGKLAGKTFEFLGNTLSVAPVAFILVSLGLAMRAPIWPFHGWFTSVMQEAPLSVVVALTGGMVPVACYLFIRLAYSLFPETLSAYAGVIVVVGSLNLVMGSICAMAQRGLRLLLAFVCLAQIGLILMGIGSLHSAGIVGAVYQLLVLGLALAGFGLFSNWVNDRVGHSTFVNEKGERTLGGVATQAPTIAIVAGIVVASLLGFPGLGGFVAQALVVIGSYSLHPMAVVLAGLALLFAVYYLFTMFKLVFLGEMASGQDGRNTGFSDLTLRERLYFLPLVASLLLFGMYPKPLIELVRPTVLTLLSTLTHTS